MHSATAAKSLQSCLTLYDPIDGHPPGSAVPGILQARTLEWVAVSFSNAWKWKVKVKSLSHVQLFTIQWTAAYQAPLSMGFCRQESWSGLPLPSPHMHSEYMLNKQGDLLQLWGIPFPSVESVCSGSNCCLLSCIQISQEMGNVVWYSHLFKNFLVYCDPHSQGFSIVNEAGIDSFLEFSCCNPWGCKESDTT